MLDVQPGQLSGWRGRCTHRWRCQPDGHRDGNRAGICGGGYEQDDEGDDHPRNHDARNQYAVPMSNDASPATPAMRPAVARVAPRVAPSDSLMRRNDRMAVQIAKGAKMPKGRLRIPSTKARVAERSFMRSAGYQNLPRPSRI